MISLDKQKVDFRMREKRNRKKLTQVEFAMEHRVDSEVEGLRKFFKGIPKNQLDVAEGLITQAARLRILLDDNWKDILENGEYEKFSQSENQIPYDRKRPIVENYDNRDKTYQSIIKQLTNRFIATEKAG